MLTKQDTKALLEAIEAAKQAAILYREITGKPLGITGEVGEVACAHLLGLDLSPARQAGYDAKWPDGRRVQIKARCVLPDSKPGQRLGRIRLEHEWDTVALVLLDERFEPISVHEAGREAVVRELTKPGSKARTQRGALGVSKFKSISELRWERDTPAG